MQKLIIVIAIIGLLIGQPVQASANDFNYYMNQILEAFSEFFEVALEEINPIFKERVLPIWTAMYKWFEENIWERIKPSTEEEIEKRRLIAQQESERKKKELLNALQELSISIPFFDQIRDFLIEAWD